MADYVAVLAVESQDLLHNVIPHGLGVPGNRNPYQFLDSLKLFSFYVLLTNSHSLYPNTVQRAITVLEGG